MPNKQLQLALSILTTITATWTIVLASPLINPVLANGTWHG